MRVLITGICGFAGNVIAKTLRESLENLTIVGLDSLIRPGSETNLEPLRQAGIEVIIGDIRDPATVAALPVTDWVIDCAANASVLAGVDGATGAKDLLDHNLLGTIHLLEYCRRHNAGFILLSTSRVYSLAPLASLSVAEREGAFVPISFPPGLGSHGITENFPAEPPMSLYGSSKRCSEILALEYHSAFGIPVRINRCGVLAGAGQFGRADQGIFSFWIHTWRARLPLKYLGFGGRGFQVRDCLHPADVGLVLVQQMTDPHRPVPLIQNFSGGNAMSLAQLSAWCEERFGPHNVLSDGRSRPFDLPWIVLDSSLARRAWDWQPARTLDTILEEIAAHAEANPRWMDLVG